MKHIKDPVYGFLELDRPFLELVDSPDLQRLRHIKQLGLTPLVYPSANHTRFEHSLGCYHLAKLVKVRDSRDFTAAALLHDLGHLAFSHSLEWLFRSKTGKSHEQVTIEKIKRNSKVLKKNGFDPGKISSMIKGKGLEGRLISGEIDIDRMDYLARDAYYTGVAYGVIDIDNLLRVLKFTGKRFGVDKKGIHSIESVILARYMMFPTVYLHPTARIAEAMLRKGVQNLLDKGKMDLNGLNEMDDTDLVSKLRKEKEIFIKLIDERRLFKESLKFGPAWADRVMKLKEDPDRFSRLEDKIAKKSGLKKGDVLIDIPEKPRAKESQMYIFDDSKKEAEWKNWYVGVYTPRKKKLNRQEVGGILDES